MRTLSDVPEMARVNAEMAIGQRCSLPDSVASYAQNVVDTLGDWGIEIGHGHHNRALACYYRNVAQLLDAK